MQRGTFTNPKLASWGTTIHAVPHAPQSADASRPVQRVAVRPARPLPRLVGKAGRRTTPNG